MTNTAISHPKVSIIWETMGEDKGKCITIDAGFGFIGEIVQMLLNNHNTKRVEVSYYGRSVDG